MSGMFRSSTIICMELTARASIAWRPDPASSNIAPGSEASDVLTILRIVGESSTMRIVYIRQRQ